MFLRLCLVPTILILTLTPQLAAAAQGGDPALHPLAPGFSNSTSSASITLQQVNQSISLSLKVDAISAGATDEGALWTIAGEGRSGIAGAPDLPVVSRWICVPDRGRIVARWSLGQEQRKQGAPPVRFQSLDEEGGPVISNWTPPEGIWPPEPVMVSDPRVWRGVRMVNVVIYPVRWDARASEYIIANVADLQIEATPEPGINEVQPGYREPCADFEKALRALAINPPHRDQPPDNQPGSYLVVANEQVPEGLDLFVQAKRSAGHTVELLLFNPEVTTRDSLKQAIRDVYQERGFSFLVLIGNEEVDSPLHIPFPNQYYDNWFGQLDGNDEIADVAVGSFNCQETENFECAIQRSIAYQYEPQMGEDRGLDWIGRAFVGVGHCSVAAGDLQESYDFSPSYSGMWVKDVLERNGYNVASTFYVNNADNDFSPDVAEQYNNGSNLIIVRGHQSDFDPDDIRASGYHPFHFLVSSSTIAPGGGGWGGSFNRAFRMGMPEDIRGPSAGFGHYPSPVTNYANAIVGGLAEALFLLDIRSFGWARNYLTANLARVMPADQGDAVTRYWGTLRYYGDPGQEPWHWINPNRPAVWALDSIARTATNLTVRVLNEQGGLPGARVVLFQDELFIKPVITDGDGDAEFVWAPGEVIDDILTLSVLHPNSIPLKMEIRVYEDDLPPLSLISTEVFPVGDREGAPYPGAPLAIRAAIKNETDGAIGPGGSELVAILEPEFGSGVSIPVELPRIDAGRQAVVEFRGEQEPLLVSDGAPNRAPIRGRIIRRFAEGEPVEIAMFEFTNYAPALRFSFSPDQQPPAVGEDTEIVLNVGNWGDFDAADLRVVVESRSPYAAVINGVVELEEVQTGAEFVELPPFNLRVAEDAIPESKVRLAVTVLGDPGVMETSELVITLEDAEVSDPFGPDAYGYIALNDGDDNTPWAEAPQYQWLDISPWGGEFRGELLDLPVQGERDSSVVVDLPFPLRYYGEEYREITVCSNGWIAVGDQHHLKNQQNWQLPSFNGAFGMIAPFWDRLKMQTRSDGVFSYFDQPNNRFIIEWHTGTEDNGQWAPNVFEVILYNPDIHRTPTGDSRILFQYRTVNNIQSRFEANDYCTVGLSSPDNTDGLTYSYWNIYPNAAARLAGGRAILWTTIGWGPFNSIEGNVRRWIDSTAVASAIIRSSGGASSISDRRGRFALPLLDDGRYDLYFEADGYVADTLRGIEVSDGELEEVEVVLAHPYPNPLQEHLEGSNIPGTPDWNNPSLEIANAGNAPLNCVLSFFLPDTSGWDSALAVGFTPDDSFAVEAGDTAVVEITIQALSEIRRASSEGLVRLTTDSPLPLIDIPLRIGYVIAVGDDPEPIPGEMILDAFPNPFNGEVTISFSLAEAGEARLEILDLQGRIIDVLARGRLGMGLHRLAYRADRLPAGLYLLRLHSGQKGVTRKILLLP